MCLRDQGWVEDDQLLGKNLKHHDHFLSHFFLSVTVTTPLNYPPPSELSTLQPAAAEGWTL